MNLLLFDVDGVLVDDRGYRASLVSTVNFFGHCMGLEDAAPDPETIEVFHAHGYTNEWEICPLAIGALIVSTLRAHPDLPLEPAPLEAFLSQFQPVRQDVQAIDYRDWVSATAGRPGRPSERALDMLLDALADLSLPDSTRDVVATVIKDLLVDPYDLARAAPTRLFQEFALGSTLFEEVYQARPRLDVMSFLYVEDRAALSSAGREELLNLIRDTGARLCVYTARPSLPPADVVIWQGGPPRIPMGYPPEAELAMLLLDLSDCPIIAMGRMLWLAERVGTKVEYLTKPAPVQALAAIIAAIIRRESEALETAYRMVSEGDDSSFLAGLRNQLIDVWVVEDARLGVHAAAGAADILRRYRVDVRLHALGVSAGGPKAEVLAGLCEAIVPSVNEAIVYIDERIRAAQPAVSNSAPLPSGGQGL